MNRARLCGLLAALLLCAQPLHIAHAAAQETETETVTDAHDTDRDARAGRLRLILGGTIVGVTGMWLTLYKRGKGK